MKELGLRESIIQPQCGVMWLSADKSHSSCLTQLHISITVDAVHP